jgi:sigma-B regulation protein RsbU (phosphoserine phosphatase)
MMSDPSTAVPWSSFGPDWIPPHENRLLLNVLDSMPEFVYIKDRDCRYLVDNRAHREFHGLNSLEELIGKTVFDLFNKELAEAIDRDDRHVLETGTFLEREERLVTGHQNREIWMRSTKMPLRAPDGTVWGLLGIGRNVTEQKSAEMALADHQRLLTALTDTIPDNIYFKDRQSRFIRVNRAMARRLGLDDPAEAVGLTDFDVFKFEHAQQAFEDEQRLMQNEEPILDKEERETWQDGHVTWVSSSKLPLRDARGELIGTFGVSRDITERKEAQMRLSRFAYDIKEINARMEADLSLASELQRTFLPSRYPCFPAGVQPEESRLQFSHLYQPTGKVGGDFFSVAALSDDRAGVFFCDVMGHGVRAALVTAMIRTLIAELGEESLHPARFLTAVNNQLRRMLRLEWETVFATACYLVVDLAAKEVEIANAGHPTPYLLHREAGTISRLNEDPDTIGPALGLRDDHVFSSQRAPIRAGEMIFLYTDGLYEVEGAGGEYFEEERLLEAATRLVRQPAEALFDGLLAEVKQFGRRDRLDDDICMLAVEIRETAGAEAGAAPVQPSAPADSADN